MNIATLSASTTESPRAGLTAASLPQPAQTNHAPRFELNGGADAPAPVKSRRPSFKRAALITFAAFAGICAAKFAHDWWTVGRFNQTTDDAFVGGDVTVIAPKVAGFISQLAVTDNQQVHAGDLLLKLDDRDYRAALAKAEATVSQAKAALVNLDATRDLQDAVIAQAQAGIAAADAEITRTHDDQVRAKNLLAGGVESTQEFQQADAEYKTATANGDKARAALTAAQRQIEVIGTQKQQAQASLDSAIAERDLAQLNLSYTELRAPMDGIVGNRSAQVGAYATVGSQLISLVPAHGLWIDANYKEDQLARMHTGSPATVQIDLLGGEKFNGHVLSIAPATGAQFSVLPAENATGNFTKIVQRVTVRILLDDEQAMAGQLRPGLSVTAKVNTKS
ncbi:MAG TPA: HlyD family secretion protein [Candidatus Sulfotelmatobacter sp.]|jgi:membrane fusion protein (multidrug efflux system)|nr:HlyD family secretion protein [Candidatus Sulfotelmatobacter sp.]